MRLHSQQQQQHDGRGFNDAIRESSSLCPRRAPLGELPGLWCWINARSERSERPRRYQAGKHVAIGARDCQLTLSPCAPRRRHPWAASSCKGLKVWAHERVDAIGTRSLDESIDAPFALLQIVLEGRQRDIESDVSAEAKAIGDGLGGRGERDLCPLDARTRPKRAGEQPETGSQGRAEVEAQKPTETPATDDVSIVSLAEGRDAVQTLAHDRQHEPLRERAFRLGFCAGNLGTVTPLRFRTWRSFAVHGASRSVSTPRLPSKKPSTDRALENRGNSDQPSVQNTPAKQV
jgi:hypothetical protein